MFGDAHEMQIDSVVDDGREADFSRNRGALPHPAAPHAGITVRNRGSILRPFDLMTLLTLLTMSKLRISAPVLLQPLDETMSTLSTMSECQRHRYLPSHRELSAIERQCSDPVSVADWQRAGSVAFLFAAAGPDEAEGLRRPRRRLAVRQCQPSSWP
jgi:hypothetical protein